MGSFDSSITDFAFRTYVVPAAVAPPTIVKAFGAGSIPLNGTTSLTFTITNPNASTGLTGVGFTDTLPAGLLIATPNNIGGSCGGAITATAGTGIVTVTGLALGAANTCGFSVDVTGTTAGTKNNTTSNITSTEGGTGGTASASVVVAAPATPTPAPTAAPTITPPPTSTVNSRGSGSDAPPLPLLTLTAVAGLVVAGFILRSEARVRLH